MKVRRKSQTKIRKSKSNHGNSLQSKIERRWFIRFKIEKKDN